jgi:ribosome-binding protein aMBF1 (putative translation factor)
MKKSHKKKTAPAVPGNDKDRRVSDVRERLLAAMKAKGLSYEDVSRQCGVSFFTIYRFGRGSVKAPNPLTISAIEKFLAGGESEE